MRKTLHVAVREFLATVATRGFIVGVLVTPLLIGIMIFVLPALMNEKPPKIDGEVAIVDPTGEVAAGVAAYLSPAAMAARREAALRHAAAAVPPGMEALSATGGPEAQAILAGALGEQPTLHVVTLDPGVDLEAAKAPLLRARGGGGERLALAVVHPDAVVKAPGAEHLGNYDLFVREKLDDRIEEEILDALRTATIDARLRAAGLDRQRVDELVEVGRVRSTTVSESGERATNQTLNLILPAGFMILLLVSVLTSGQYVMTTTVEEKSSRVVEILLSAVSPMQLMTGKILGQMCVGLVVLGLYAAMGVSALVSFAVLGLVDPSLFVYLVIFFLLSFFFMGSFMAAIGAAVNELREAQTLMTPVMVTLMIPWVLWMPISRDPNSVFALVTSFLPPINSFVMLLRMTSTTPPPLWQVWLSIAVGVVAVYGVMRFAAKVFRVGLLMYGKPPTFGTLVRWVRMS